MATNRIESEISNGQVVTDSANKLDTDKVLSETIAAEIMDLKAKVVAAKAQDPHSQLPNLSLTDKAEKPPAPGEMKPPAPKDPGGEKAVMDYIDSLKTVKSGSDTNRDGYMSKEELTAYIDNPLVTGFKLSVAKKTLSQFDALDNLRYGFFRDGRIGDGDIERFKENSVVAALAKDGSPGASANPLKFVLNSSTVVDAVAGWDGSASKNELRNYALDAGHHQHLRRTAAVLLKNYDHLSLGRGYMGIRTINGLGEALSPDLGKKLEELNADPKNHDDHAVERAVGGALVGGAMGSLMSSGRGNYGFGGAMLGGAMGASSAESEWEKTYKELRNSRNHLRATGLFRMENQPLLDEK